MAIEKRQNMTVFQPKPVRGFFGIGAEGISKKMNMGNLIRSGHAFGASFVFNVNAEYTVRGAHSDTSKTVDNIPYYEWNTVGDMILPAKCKLVGVELTDDAIDLPSFRHPIQAAYVMGPERGSLSDEMMEKCAYIIKIPTKFCINVQIAGSVVMYDRVRSLGYYPPRPLMPGGPKEARMKHQHGGRFSRHGIKARQAEMAKGSKAAKNEDDA